MDIINWLVDFVLHLDRHLAEIVASMGLWTYVILFGVIFVETGLVIMPFLPGDSLLFAAGAIAALEGAKLNVAVLFVILAGAAVIGDSVNYWIGHKVGPAAFSGKIRFLKKEHLDRTHAFYEKHGGKTIFLARFMPIVRTFAPFVAGIGRMRYGYFLTYNVVGGVIWTALFIFGGYYFGNIPFVKENFSLVVIAIVLLSISPALYEIIRSKRKERQAKAAAKAAEVVVEE